MLRRIAKLLWRRSIAKRDASASVFLHKKTSTFQVQAHGMHPLGGVTHYGEPVEVPAEEFEERIALAVLGALDRFHREVLRADQMLPAERAFAVRDYFNMGVDRLRSGDVRLTPMRRMAGGWVGYKEDYIVVAQQRLLSDLPKAIREGFESLSGRLYWRPR